MTDVASVMRGIEVDLVRQLVGGIPGRGDI
jgi:hypothetical protein